MMKKFLIIKLNVKKEVNQDEKFGQEEPQEKEDKKQTIQIVRIGDRFICELHILKNLLITILYVINQFDLVFF